MILINILVAMVSIFILLFTWDYIFMNAGNDSFFIFRLERIFKIVRYKIHGTQFKPSGNSEVKNGI